MLECSVIPYLSENVTSSSKPQISNLVRELWNGRSAVMVYCQKVSTLGLSDGKLIQVIILLLLYFTAELPKEHIESDFLL